MIIRIISGGADQHAACLKRYIIRFRIGLRGLRLTLPARSPSGALLKKVAPIWAGNHRGRDCGPATTRGLTTASNTNRHKL